MNKITQKEHKAEIEKRLNKWKEEKSLLEL